METIFFPVSAEKNWGTNGKGTFYIEHFPLPIFVHDYWFTGVHVLSAPQLDGSSPLFLKYLCFLAIIVLYTEGKA